MSLLPSQSHDASDSDAIAERVPQANGSRPKSKLIVMPLPSPSLPESGIPILKVIPQPVRWQSFLHPLWLVSLGFHLVFLSIPISTQQSPPKPTRSVKLTKLAPAQRIKTKIPPKPKLGAQTNPVINPSPSLPVRSAPIAVGPKPAQLKQTPKVAPSSEATPEATPKAKTKPEQDRGDERGLKNFPQYPDSSPACGDYCSETSADLTTVANYFVKTLKAQAWQVTPLNTEETGGQQLFYQLTKGKLQYVLSILTTATNKTQFMLANQPLRPADFAQAEASAGTVGEVLDKASGGNKVTEDSIAQKELFASKPSIISSFLIEGAKPDSAIATISANLATKGFEVEKTPQTYANGPIYAVKLNIFTGYLNPVLSSDGKGTVIVFWKMPPA
jgi:hypothetical protein